MRDIQSYCNGRCAPREIVSEKTATVEAKRKKSTRGESAKGRLLANARPKYQTEYRKLQKEQKSKSSSGAISASDTEKRKGKGLERSHFGSVSIEVHSGEDTGGDEQRPSREAILAHVSDSDDTDDGPPGLHSSTDGSDTETDERVLLLNARSKRNRKNTDHVRFNDEMHIDELTGVMTRPIRVQNG